MKRYYFLDLRRFVADDNGDRPQIVIPAPNYTEAARRLKLWYSLNPRRGKYTIPTARFQFSKPE